MPLQENEYESYNREDFDALLNDIEEISRRPELVSPLIIASPPFNRIFDTIHLVWIRQQLSAMIKDKQPKNIMMMVLLHTAHFGKSSQWTIDEGIPILMNESPMLITPSNQARSTEIAYFVKEARKAYYLGSLQAKEIPDGSLIVIPENLLNWAEKNHVPVDTGIAKAIREELLGHIPPKINKGWQVRQQVTEKIYKAWQTEADKLKKEHPKLSKLEIAKKISCTNIGNGRDSETIRKKIKIQSVKA